MYVATVTIDNTKVSADLTDYVVYVNLNHLPSSFWDVVADGGGDIRCFKSDGTTELARDVVSCVQASDTGELHVKYSGTLSSSVDTVIQIHADGTSSEPAVGATYGRNAVWSAYWGVYHLQSSAVSSTGSNDFTEQGGITYNADATKIGTATPHLDGSADYFQKTAVNLGNVFTVQTWQYLDAYTANDDRFIWSYGLESGTNYRIAHGKYWIADNDWEFGVYNGSTYKQADDPASGDITTWKKHDTIYDGANTDGYFYINGSLPAGNQVTDFHNIDIASATFQIGNFSGVTPSGHFDGSIEEVRIIESVLSATWLSTEYNNQNSPSTFYTAEAVGGATVNSGFFNFM